MEKSSFFLRPSQGEWEIFLESFFVVFKDCFLWASQTKMVEVRQGDIKGKVPKTPNNGTTNIPILSLEVWEWYGEPMGRQFNYWGSLEKSRNDTILKKNMSK